MELTEKLYYPLDKAMEKLNDEEMKCDIADLFYFAAIGKLEICAKVKFLPFNRGVLINPPKWLLRMKDNYLCDANRFTSWSSVSQEDHLAIHVVTDFGNFVLRRSSSENIVRVFSFDSLLAMHPDVFLKWGLLDKDIINKRIEGYAIDENDGIDDEGCTYGGLPWHYDVFASLKDNSLPIALRSSLMKSHDHPSVCFSFENRASVRFSDLVITRKGLDAFKKAAHDTHPG